jgi:hypothetical protein
MSAESDRPAPADFDVERLRRLWDGADPVPVPASPAIVARVETPINPFPEARRLLQGITAIAATHPPFRQKARSLKPFLDEAEGLLSRMEKASPPESANLPEGQPSEEIEPLREQLRKVLDDLEDLFEVYAGIGLR